MKHVLHGLQTFYGNLTAMNTALVIEEVSGTALPNASPYSISTGCLAFTMRNRGWVIYERENMVVAFW